MRIERPARNALAREAGGYEFYPLNLSVFVS